MHGHPEGSNADPKFGTGNERIPAREINTFS